MSDLIERQAAIDALEKVADMFPWRVPGNRDTYDRYNEAWNDAIGRAEMEIENMPSSQPGWIPCKTALPSKYDNYLITTEDGMVVFGVYDPREKQWCRYDSIKSWWLYGIKVFAWMPLPTPYREGGQDGKD